MPTMQWFRLYSEFFHDPKMRSFSKSQQRDVLALMALASESKTRGTVLFEDEDIAGWLEVTVEELQILVEKLLRKHIIERNNDGFIVFSNWMNRQYDKPSDYPENVNERKKKHRSQMEGTHRNADGTPLEHDRNADGTPYTQIQIQRRVESSSSLRSEEEDLFHSHQNVNENAPEKVLENQPSPKTGRKAFKQPTLDEVKAYAASIELGEDGAEHFHDYQTSCGWKVGTKPMIDWKAALRTWKANAARFPARKNSPPSPPADRNQTIMDDLQKFRAEAEAQNILKPQELKPQEKLTQ